MAADSFLWIVVAGSVAAFLTAFAIGANDVANTFSTAVGGKTLSLKTAIILGSVFEIIGATLLGSAVTDTIRKKIIDYSVFDDSPGILMMGMLCSLVGSGLWVLIATHFALPVSTTHSILGSLVGFGIASGKFWAIRWNMIGTIILCWLCAPFIAGLLGSFCFGMIRTFILRHGNALQRGYRALFPLMLLVCATFSYFLVFHNPFIFYFSCFQISESGKSEILSPCTLSRWARANSFFAVLFVLLFSFVLAVFLSIGAHYLVRLKLKNINSNPASDQAQTLEIGSREGDFPQNISCKLNIRKNMSDSLKNISFETVCSQTNLENPLCYKNRGVMTQTPDAPPSLSDDPVRSRNSSWMTMGWMDSPCEMENDELVKTIHSSAEEFSVESESFFSACQIFSSCLGCLAHSTNDTANAIGPLSLIYFSYRDGSVASTESIPWYIFFCGGVSMALGLVFLGHKVVNTMGNQIVKITPSRGFSIDVGASWVVMLFSMFGIPLSTTHSTVGSTVGVGLVEKGSTKSEENASLNAQLHHLNWKLLINIFLSWIITLFFSCRSRDHVTFFLRSLLSNARLVCYFISY
ncbi:putative phosphate transporter family protein [Cardiosporidium cionae]|uniref:Phosphate transporter n=1 Tax=Cardiosporidium cionae TaxID=476202 RepID=A0ABQ7JCY9_9APIC|nr:putative phosphate transporter family protein [Cardiosporidium cionae]|eukprot:KAF8821855.1 putative phosphate transporter family protein [Cardiosporidium cionae]